MLTKVLAPPPIGDSDLRRRIAGQEPLLASRLFPAEAQGLWPVLVAGGREPLGRALLHALRQLAPHLPEGALPLPSDEARLGERGLARLYESASKSMQEHVPGCRGLLVVVDELGKFLEFAALHPRTGRCPAAARACRTCRAQCRPSRAAGDDPAPGVRRIRASAFPDAATGMAESAGTVFRHPLRRRARRDRATDRWGYSAPSRCACRCLACTDAPGAKGPLPGSATDAEIADRSGVCRILTGCLSAPPCDAARPSPNIPKVRPERAVPVLVPGVRGVARVFGVRRQPPSDA